ncbi:M48 family metallopeptidase [Quatrionicoccus australiensis]|uniref:M48 family metallopeptidase n=1 Tax=Quatrionicoccus australiensis TaxID=138118 RepID=UPI001CF891FE|nr:SprT family zinc-dependent metalloprotease [Quatrionicoccus australiensis]UCV15782.1 M48 family metallopeptidase [Quatrionicoccus australiensis]
MSTTTPAETSHRIALAGEEVGYQLRRSKRRTIGLAIDQRGLRVAAPLRARLGDIEKLIREHGQWVLDKLANWRERPPPEKTQIVDGSIISVLGETLTVTVTPLGRARWQFVDAKLHLWPSATVNANQLLEKALREKARSLFVDRLALHAPRLGVASPALRLSSARTRWGSCSHHGGISLNWRLIFMPLPVVDYVVCHELAHLKEMNHSPRFWSVVEQLCPDWRALRIELRQLGRQIPQL